MSNPEHTIDWSQNAETIGRRYTRIAEENETLRAELGTLKQAQETGVVWEDCCFEGSPPEPFENWIDWACSRVKRNVTIRSSRRDDFEKAQDKSCPNGECGDRTQCWEQCGELGHSEEHCRVIQQAQVELVGEVFGNRIKWSVQVIPADGTKLYTSAPTIPAVTKPEREVYCSSCGKWLGGPVICCHHWHEKPPITKTEAKALRAMLSAAPKPGEPT